MVPTESLLKIKSFEEFTLLVVPKNIPMANLYREAAIRGLTDNLRGEDGSDIWFNHALRERTNLFVTPRGNHSIPSLYWVKHMRRDQIFKFYKPWTDWELQLYLKKCHLYISALIASVKEHHISGWNADDAEANESIGTGSLYEAIYPRPLVEGEAHE